MQQPIQLAAHRLKQLPPHRRGEGLDGGDVDEYGGGMGLSSEGKLFGAVRVGLALNSSGSGMQSQAQSLGHLEHGCET